MFNPGQLILALLLLVGCSNPKGQERAFQIMVPKEANGGELFYCAAKPTEVKEFYLDDCQSIAAQTFLRSEKKGALERALLIPGETQTLRVYAEDPSQPVALYFLFTEPGEEWKILFDNPNCSHYKVTLEKNTVGATHGY